VTAKYKTYHGALQTCNSSTIRLFCAGFEQDLKIHPYRRKAWREIFEEWLATTPENGKYVRSLRSDNIKSLARIWSQRPIDLDLWYLTKSQITTSPSPDCLILNALIQRYDGWL